MKNVYYPKLDARRTFSSKFYLFVHIYYNINLHRHPDSDYSGRHSNYFF